MTTLHPPPLTPSPHHSNIHAMKHIVFLPIDVYDQVVETRQRYLQHRISHGEMEDTIKRLISPHMRSKPAEHDTTLLTVRCKALFKGTGHVH